MILSESEPEEEEEEEAAVCLLRFVGVRGHRSEVVGRLGESSEGVADDLACGGFVLDIAVDLDDEPGPYVLDLDLLMMGRDDLEGVCEFDVEVEVDGTGVGMDRLTVFGFEARAYLSPPGVEKKSMTATRRCVGICR